MFMDFDGCTDNFLCQWIIFLWNTWILLVISFYPSSGKWVPFIEPWFLITNRFLYSGSTFQVPGSKFNLFHHPFVTLGMWLTRGHRDHWEDQKRWDFSLHRSCLSLTTRDGNVFLSRSVRLNLLISKKSFSHREKSGEGDMSYTVKARDSAREWLCCSKLAFQQLLQEPLFPLIIAFPQCPQWSQWWKTSPLQEPRFNPWFRLFPWLRGENNAFTGTVV